MVLDHHDDRALVDREIGFGVPAPGQIERVLEAVLAPDPIAEVVMEMP